MGTLVDTGLGWYLDSDYLLTLGSQTMGSVDGSGADPRLTQVEIPLGTYGAPVTTSDLYIGKYGGHAGYVTSTVPKVYFAFYRTNTYYGICSYSLRSDWYRMWGYPDGSYGNPAAIEGPTTQIGDWHYQGGVAYNGPTEANAAIPVFDSYDELRNALLNYSSKIVTKVQGGAGAFAFVSYPHNGTTVHVGVGISSIPNPNSAATVAVDGVNGDYNTFNHEEMQFTVFYTEQLTGTLTANVPVVVFDTDISGLPGLYEFRLFRAVVNAAKIHVGYVPADEDPYADGGTSGPGGGTDTDFDITGDTILDSPLPTFSFANSGFARIYNPDLSQLQRLANYLWTDTNFLQTVVNHAKQLLEDPIESIITLNRLPISVPNGTAEVVKVLFIPTNTSMPPVTNQFVDVDCGTLQIKHEYDSALDYNPYTDISLVLPFIGVVQLDPDEVMDKTLSLTYRVDVVSGMCVAKVAVDGCVLYQYSGNCAISMPFNSADFSNYISAMVTAAKSITGVAAAGAAGAMAAAAEGTEAVKAIVAKATSGELESTGPSLPALSNKSTNVFKETFGKGGVGEGTLKAAKKGVANTVSAVVSSKRTIEHAGHFSGNSGFLGVRRPYAIIKRPRMCNPDEYGKFNGRPCMMYLYLGNLSGYTEVQEIHLTGILATNDELVEIENLLKSGVIL